MGDRSGIEWTDATWNPIRGCSRVSEGCRNCYAERVAARFSGKGEPYEGLALRSDVGAARRWGWTGEIRLVEEHIADPLRWRRPRRVFVNSMSDLFHEKVPDEWIDRVFAVMALAPQHTFQILTKRPQRMRAYLSDEMRTSWRVAYEMLVQRGDREEGGARSAAVQDGSGWPLPNVWLGGSVENQPTFDERWPHLRDTPAARRFISYEPALAGVDFRSATEPMCGWCGGSGSLPVDGGGVACGACFKEKNGNGGPMPSRLDWLIVGGESGPGARPFDVAWARSTIAACRAAGVACFVKQLGAEPCDGFVEGAQPSAAGPLESALVPNRLRLRARKGGDPAEWPEDLRVREFPAAAAGAVR